MTQVTLSLCVSYLSGILVLGTSSEMVYRGSTYWWACLGIAASALLTCFVFVPVFYYLKLTSVYEVTPLSPILAHSTSKKTSLDQKWESQTG